MNAWNKLSAVLATVMMAVILATVPAQAVGAKSKTVNTPSEISSHSVKDRASYNKAVKQLTKYRKKHQATANYEASVDQFMIYRGKVSTQEISGALYSIYAKTGPKPGKKYYGSYQTTVTTEAPIPFTIQDKNDAKLPKGQTTVTQQGVNGVGLTTWNVTMVNNKETNRTIATTRVKTQPIAQITTHGTYVAPVVKAAPAPTVSSSSSPLTNNTGGATAKCVDGSLSYSAHRQGTCSHHGGVSIWY